MYALVPKYVRARVLTFSRAIMFSCESKGWGWGVNPIPSITTWSIANLRSADGITRMLRAVVESTGVSP